MSDWRQRNIGGPIEPEQHRPAHRAQQHDPVAPERGQERTSYGNFKDPEEQEARRRRTEWLKGHVRPMIALGQLDEDDLQALPPAARAKAEELVAECARLHESGANAQAQYLAEESAAILEGVLPKGWEPPRDADDPEAVADRIRGNRW